VPRGLFGISNAWRVRRSWSDAPSIYRCRRT
jgi:hypothetical protein